jgi:hypothetical protein
MRLCPRFSKSTRRNRLLMSVAEQELGSGLSRSAGVKRPVGIGGDYVDRSQLIVATSQFASCDLARRFDAADIFRQLGTSERREICPSPDIAQFYKQNAIFYVKRNTPAHAGFMARYHTPTTSVFDVVHPDHCRGKARRLKSRYVVQKVFNFFRLSGACAARRFYRPRSWAMSAGPPGAPIGPEQAWDAQMTRRRGGTGDSGDWKFDEGGKSRPALDHGCRGVIANATMRLVRVARVEGG